MKKSHKPIAFFIAVLLILALLININTNPLYSTNHTDETFDQVQDSYNQSYTIAGLDSLRLLPIPPDFNFLKTGSLTEQDSVEENLDVFDNTYSQTVHSDSTDSAVKLLEFIESGRDLFDKGDYKSALGEYNLAVQLAPDLAPLYIERGQVYSRLKNYDKALDDLNKAIRLDSELTIAYLVRGKLLNLLNQREDALKDLNLVLEKEPSNINALLERGVIYTVAGKWFQVANDANAVIDQEPKNAQAWWMLAMAYQNLGEYTQAFDAWDRTGRVNRWDYRDIY
ncbi:MAG: tetratricopeptide repeat protein [Tepidanaerobacteraceae bacterium]